MEPSSWDILGQKLNTWGQENCSRKVGCGCMCMYVYAWVSIYINIYEHTHIYITHFSSSRGSIAFTCFSICHSTWISSRVYTYCTENSEVQQCHPVGDLKGLKVMADKWPQQDKLTWNIRYCTSLRNQLAYFPLVVSQANYYFSVQKINNLNALQPIGKYFRQADEQCAC